MCDIKELAKQVCAELNAASGNYVRGFIGVLHDLDTTTAAFTVGNNGRSITAFDFLPGKGLHEIWVRKEGFQDTSETEGGEPGAGKVQAQTVIASIRKLGVEFREAINSYLDAEDLFIVLQSNAGELKVFGLYDLLDTKLMVSKGMTATLSNDSGVAFTDVSGQTVTFVGQSKYYAGMIFGTGVLATDLATLNGYLASESGSSSSSVS
jgi:hypothetical protein